MLLLKASLRSSKLSIFLKIDGTWNWLLYKQTNHSYLSESTSAAETAMMQFNSIVWCLCLLVWRNNMIPLSATERVIAAFVPPSEPVTRLISQSLRANDFTPKYSPDCSMPNFI